MAERSCSVNAESGVKFSSQDGLKMHKEFSFQKEILPLVYATLRWIDG
jgi:hypothetical protein